MTSVQNMCQEFSRLRWSHFAAEDGSMISWPGGSHAVIPKRDGDDKFPVLILFDIIGKDALKA